MRRRIVIKAVVVIANEHENIEENIGEAGSEEDLNEDIVTPSALVAKSQDKEVSVASIFVAKVCVGASDC